MKMLELYVNNHMRTKIISADNFFLRLRGLIGRNVAGVGGLLLLPCSQIHTFFMSSAIDVVYLSKNNTVLRIDRAVPPRRCCRVQAGAHSVLELPPGMANIYEIQPGETVSFR